MNDRLLQGLTERATQHAQEIHRLQETRRAHEGKTGEPHAAFSGDAAVMIGRQLLHQQEDCLFRIATCIGAALMDSEVAAAIADEIGLPTQDDLRRDMTLAYCEVLGLTYLRNEIEQQIISRQTFRIDPTPVRRVFDKKQRESFQLFVSRGGDLLRTPAL